MTIKVIIDEKTETDQRDQKKETEVNLDKSRNNINELAFKSQKLKQDNTCILLQPIR